MIWLEGLRQDVRFALRSLVRAPLFLAVAMATVALGVGANTATFSVLKSVALNQLPFREPDRLVWIAETDGRTPNPQNVAFATVADWRQRCQSFEALSLFQDLAVRPVEHGRTDFLRGLRVNHNFFDLLGIKMYLGRSFQPDEDRPDTNNKLILSYGLWKRRYGGDPSVVGRVIPTTNLSYTIVGVLPPDFHPLHMSNPGEVPEFYRPLGFDPDDRSCRSCRDLRAVGRLKAGVNVKQARAELNSIMRQLAAEYPADYAWDASVVVTSFRDQLVGRFDTALWILFGAVGLLLLLACANISNLVLVRAIGRSGEMAVRAALGASRWRMMRQMLVESLLVALAGGSVGTSVACGATRLIAHIGGQEIPRVDEIGPDAGMLLWGLGVSVLTGLLFGLAPALQASRPHLQSALRGANHRGSRNTFQQALIVSEIALAFVLVLTVGLLGKSYWRLMEVNPGYDPRNVLTMSLLPASSRYDTFDKRLRYFEAVAQRVRSVAGVERVGYASTIPLSNSESRRLYVRERAAASGEAPHLDTYYVSANYFDAMKIPLLRGRFIDGRDRRRLAPVAVVSESCARTQFKGEDPIGQHVQVDARDEQAPWATIVGIVGDVHQYALDTAPDAAVYLGFVQAKEPQGFGRLIVRCAVDPELMRTAVTDAMRSVDPTQVVFHVQPMDAYIAKSVAQRTFVLALIGTFGAMALVLAMVGIYGVISYSVAMRTREVGIRMALGADAGDVIFMILRQVFGTALAGLGIGLCGSLLCSGALSSLLFGVKPTDAATISGVAALLCAVALAASYVPARRAARLEPAWALRVE
jgi:putative ABC transport system permease protein